jgi:hypothetical protein
MLDPLWTKRFIGAIWYNSIFPDGLDPFSRIKRPSTVPRTRSDFTMWNFLLRMQWAHLKANSTAWDATMEWRPSLIGAVVCFEMSPSVKGKFTWWNRCGKKRERAFNPWERIESVTPTWPRYFLSSCTILSGRSSPNPNGPSSRQRYTMPTEAFSLFAYGKRCCRSYLVPLLTTDD